jgi:hypothetical protein
MTIGSDPGRARDAPPLRWPLLVVLLSILSVAVVLIVVDDLAPQDGAAPAANRRTPLTTSSPPAWRASRTAATVSAMTPVTARSLAEEAGNAFDVCGLDPMPVATRGAPAADPIPPQTLREARARVAGALQRSTDERVRAVAALLPDAAVPLAATATSAPALTVANGALGQLAQLAARSRDPVVYSLAVQGCSAAGAPPRACELVSVAQWSRLEPGNAVPWLHLAAAAHARADSAGESEAMYRAANAAQSNPHWGAVPAIVAQALPADVPAIARTVAILDAWSVQEALTLPPLQVALDHCSAAALRDSNRRQTCEGLAGVLVATAMTAYEAHGGRRIAERLGWPDDRLTALRDEERSALDAAGRHIASGGLSCVGIERIAQWAGMAQQMGEVRAALELQRRGAAAGEASAQTAQTGSTAAARTLVSGAGAPTIAIAR